LRLKFQSGFYHWSLGLIWDLEFGILKAMSFTVLILLGRSGSGKGTQAKMLAEKFGLKLISSGNLLRAKAKDSDFTGKKIAQIISQGGILPTPVVFDLWMDELKGIVFEGSPRRLYEAWLLQEALEFFGFGGNIKAFYLNISKQEAKKRLLKRGRPDDTPRAIDKRLDWFEKEVVPVIDFYRRQRILIEINGHQPPENVFRDIVQHLMNKDGSK